ncbi:hypothetical protein A6S26_10775 [Nostoc sp. ATCC 43529]|nr:hypothetical protein A6S26_10775 [Nostoc sp. ATCC 43529]
MNSHILLSINIEASNGNGEDSHLIYDDDYSEFVVLGAFDGLGGRSAGFDGMTGGQIASREAHRISEGFLRQWKGQLTKEIASELQNKICQFLKSEAELKMGKSRLSGTLTGKRLCTTIAIASIPKNIEFESSAFEISLAWMGDSRVYFLSPQKGLQQLTIDDLEVEKDAFQMIREDPRMSQYLTADIPSDWQIHFSLEKFEEKGCVLVCTDGCFQYLPAPWDFEKLLLETLVHSGTTEDWKNLLIQRYEQIKQDDVSLALYAVGFSDFDDTIKSYQSRLQALSVYNSDTSNNNLNQLWNSYRCDYETRLKIKVAVQPVKEDVVKISDNIVEKLTNQTQSEIQTSEIQSEEVANEISASSYAKYTNINAASQINFPIEDNREISTGQVKYLLQQASRYQTYSQFTEAIYKYQEVLNLEPNNPEAILNLGRINLRCNNYHESINYFKRLINKKCQYYEDSLGFIAEAYYSIQDYYQSVIYFEELKKILFYGGFNDFQLEMYADSLLRINRPEETLKVCDVIHQRDRHNPLAFYLKGYIFHRSNRFSEAKQYFEQSLKLYQGYYQTTRLEPLRQMFYKVDAEYREVCRKLNDPYLRGGY